LATIFERKIQLRGGYGVEPTRINKKRKAKEGLAENNTRGSLACWEYMERN
jgi:hypothetical protein